VCYHTGHNKEGSNGLDQHQAVPRLQSYNGNVAHNMTITEVYNEVTKHSSQCTSITQMLLTIGSMESPQSSTKHTHLQQRMPRISRQVLA
jgi:hypothetical protein